MSENIGMGGMVPHPRARDILLLQEAIAKYKELYYCDLDSIRQYTEADEAGTIGRSRYIHTENNAKINENVRCSRLLILGSINILQHELDSLREGIDFSGVGIY